LRFCLQTQRRRDCVVTDGNETGSEYMTFPRSIPTFARLLLSSLLMGACIPGSGGDSSSGKVLASHEHKLPDGEIIVVPELNTCNGLASYERSSSLPQILQTEYGSSLTNCPDSYVDSLTLPCGACVVEDRACVAYADSPLCALVDVWDCFCIGGLWSCWIEQFANCGTFPDPPPG
jgi:hypothetical protein